MAQARRSGPARPRARERAVLRLLPLCARVPRSSSRALEPGLRTLFALLSRDELADRRGAAPWLDVGGDRGDDARVRAADPLQPPRAVDRSDLEVSLDRLGRHCAGPVRDLLSRLCSPSGRPGHLAVLP